MRFIAFFAIEILPTSIAVHFWSHPSRKVRTSLVLAKTGRTVLSEAVVMRGALGIVGFFTVTSEMVSIQEARDAGDTVIVVFNF